MKELAPSALAGVGLSLNPEGKEKGSWWHSTAKLVLLENSHLFGPKAY